MTWLLPLLRDRAVDAIASYRADSTRTPAAEALANACAEAAVAATAAQDAADATITAQSVALAKQANVIRTEPGRTEAAVAAGIQQYRVTERRPSRLRWFLSGAAVAALVFR